MTSLAVADQRELKAEIKRLELYLVDQNASVTVVMEQWNDQLRVLSHDVGEAHEDKEELLRENMRLEAEIVSQKDRLHQVTDLYQRTTISYKQHIDELRQEYANLLSSVN